jgi:BCCT family betaine/carnitine transporter
MEPRIFFPGLIIVAFAAFMMVVFPDMAGVGVKASYTFIMKNFSSLFMIVGFICFVLVLWLGFGRYGSVKLGGPDDKPEFSTFSWIAMLFCTGIGIGLLIWSIVEPIYYLEGPPLGIAPMSDEAYRLAHMLPQFHWGFSAWAIYCLPTIPIVYSVYVRREGAFRISDTCRPVLKGQADGFLGRAIELFVLLGAIGATGTTMGLAIPLISKLISNAFGLTDSIALKAVITMIVGVIFGISACLGLKKGIQNLSLINVWGALLLLVMVLVLGPMSFILDLCVNSLGVMFQNFATFTFQTEPYRLVAGGSDSWPQWWTVFYWAWWVAYAPLVALFVARISKGRTIRELVIAECFWGTLGCWSYLAVFGAYSLYLQKSGLLDVSGIRQSLGDPAACLAVMSTLPLKGLIIPLYTLMCLIFVVTILDSSSFALANLCTKKGYSDGQPARWNRLVWALCIAVFGLGILVTGGESALRTIQTSTIVGGVLLVPIFVIMVWSLLKSLREDFVGPPFVTVAHVSSKLSGTGGVSKD